MPDAPEQDPRVYFAAERTFLAWIRTGLGLIGIGFTVARFGLFLREMQASETHTIVQETAHSVVSGVVLVSLGVIVLIGAMVQHSILIRELRTGTWMPGRVSGTALLLAGGLALIGMAMAVYLLILR